MRPVPTIKVASDRSTARTLPDVATVEEPATYIFCVSTTTREAFGLASLLNTPTETPFVDPSNESKDEA